MPNPADELIDYEEDEELVQVSTSADIGVAKDVPAAAGEKVMKKGYVGVHSTGFRDFLLKPELLRAIVDCGFEHPSEGMHPFLCIADILLCNSSARMYSSSYSRYGCSLPGCFWYGKDCSFCPGHFTTD